MRWLPAVLVACGCSPGAFTDLQDRAPIDSNGAPGGVDSRTFPVASVGVPGREGLRFVAVGNDPLSVASYVYERDDGVLSIAGANVEIAGFDGDLDVPPTLAAANDDEDTSGLFFVGGLDDANEILVFEAGDGSAAPTQVDTIDADDCPGLPIEDIGTAMVFANTDAGNAATPDLVALAETPGSHSELLLFADYAPGTRSCQRCELKLADGTAVRGRAMAAIELSGQSGEAVQIVMAVRENIATGRAGFEVFNLSDAFNGVTDSQLRCFPIADPLISLEDPETNDPDNDFGRGLVVGAFSADDIDDIALTRPADDEIRIQINPAAGVAGTPVIVPVPLERPQGAFLLAGGDVTGADGDELLVTRDLGATGDVLVLSLPPANGEPPPAIRLLDSNPEPNRFFGRSLAIARFQRGDENDDVVVIGGQDEIFAVFAATNADADPRFP